MKKIEENGLTFEEADLDLMAFLHTKEGQLIFNEPQKHPIKVWKYSKEQMNPSYRKTMDQFYQSSQNADLIIFHPKAFGAQDIAEKLAIPCICMSPVPFIYPITEFANPALFPKSNFGSILNKLTYQVVRFAESNTIKEINDFRQSTLELPKRKTGAYTYTINGWKIPIVYPLSPTLFTDVTSWKDNVYLSGFSVLTANKELDPNIHAFIQAGTKPIVITFSSMPVNDSDSLYKLILEALTKTDNRAIILTGKNKMTFPENDRILSVEAAPHDKLFPFAKGIVHHGGIGTLAMALLSGKPQVIMPFSVDQPFWANRLFTQGIALKPLSQKKLTTKEFIDRFRSFDDPVIIERAFQEGEKLNNKINANKLITYLETLVTKA